MSKNSWTAEKKTKNAYVCASITVLFALFVGVLVATSSDQILPLVLGIGALVYGPICLIAYLIEIKRGVFSGIDDADEEEEAESVE